MKKINLIAAFIVAVSSCGVWAAEKNQAASAQPRRQAAPTAKAKIIAHANFSVATEANTKLRVVFSWNSAEKSFSSELAKRLAGAVVLDKAEIVLNAPGDLIITLSPEFELLDKSGAYYRVNCNKITVTIASKQKIYAMTTVELRPLPRKLEMQNAKNQYIAPAIKAIVPFLKKELDKISREQLAVSVVEFTLAKTKGKADARHIAAQVNKISQLLSSTPGIIDFANIHQNVSGATCSFRVVYLNNRFPQGIVNMLNSKLNNTNK